MPEHTTPQNTDPVAMIDRVGRTWGRDLIDGSVGLCFRHPDVAQAHPLEELRERYGPLAALYAHPPVTAEPVVERVRVGDDTYIPAVNVVAWMDGAAKALAEARGVNAVHWADVASGIERMAAKIRITAEPATAPSVGQILEALKNTPRVRTLEEIAADIHALWSPAPGDADRAELTDARERAGRYAGDANHAESRAEKAEGDADEARGHLREIYDTLADAGAPKSGAVEMAKWAAGRVRGVESGPRVDMYEPGSSVYLDGDVWVPGKDYDEKLAENERLRAALEAAEALVWAEQSYHAAKANYASAGEGFKDAHGLREKRQEQFDAARAAVEADAEGARDE